MRIAALPERPDQLELIARWMRVLDVLHARLAPRFYPVWPRAGDTTLAGIVNALYECLQRKPAPIYPDEVDRVLSEPMLDGKAGSGHA